ncbi:Choline kinase [Zalerion maritima]|uniref:Choline kinase n=1 Tax=Zalerion maritima TaxID=339359 RepID=A0AAD5WTN5_9PEZI|nr:Choline kinase [Zalerion maritima]
MSTPSPSLKGVGMPLRSALKNEDERSPPPSGSVKAVQIAEPPETTLSLHSEEPHNIKQFSVGLGNVRMSGRPPLNHSSSRSSIVSVPSIEGMNGYVSGASLSATEIPEEEVVNHESQRRHQGTNGTRSHHHGKRGHHAAEKMLAQVAEWLQHEKEKAKSKKKHYHHRRKTSPPAAAAAEAATTVSKPSPSAEAAPAPKSSHLDETAVDVHSDTNYSLQDIIGRARTNSVDSDSSEISFDRLQRILDDGMSSMGLSSVPHLSPHGLRPRRGSSGRRRRHSHGSWKGLSRAYSSDTDYIDGDVVVPSCDAVLDNNKAMSYTMGRAGVSSSSLVSIPGENDGPGNSGYTTISAPSLSRKYAREEAEQRAWLRFKTDIIRLAHTLRLKGWRRVPFDNPEAADEVSVERLSGALTNAVYVVTPPPGLSKFSTSTANSTANSTASLASNQTTSGKRNPEKLLLRIYGPQVEHLIDRETELSVLRRLSRKKIGPRLLGTFRNGRFEQYLNASPLTAELLREPEVSVKIAKRMRELHDGVEVLDYERLAGPAVWQSWEKWLDMVEKRVKFMDRLVKEGNGRACGWKGKGYICGVEWDVLRDAIAKHKTITEEYYQKKDISVHDRLVFAHNDTQYGNILRIHPSDEKSPLLTPANEHKQLVVIDFEYAAANTPGLEFANHFTEWAYNYHDELRPHECNEKRYPSPEEQKRFIGAYIDHRPQYSVSGANTPMLAPQPNPPGEELGANGSASGSLGDKRRSTGTPSFLPHTGSSSSIVEFMLDARIPPGGWKEEERKHDEERDAMMGQLLEETRLWRLANSAHWVAWGMVQARIKGFVDYEDLATPTPTAGDEKQLGGHCNKGKEIVETGETKGQEVTGEDPPSPLESEDAASDEFDYISYAHERAMWLVGDCIGMGVLTWDDVPEESRDEVKIVEY